MGDFRGEKEYILDKERKLKVFLERELHRIQDGTLTIVLQDSRAIQVNICEKFTGTDGFYQNKPFEGGKHNV